MTSNVQIRFPKSGQSDVHAAFGAHARHWLSASEPLLYRCANTFSPDLNYFAHSVTTYLLYVTIVDTRVLYPSHNASITMSKTVDKGPDPSLHLPRILCLHGGGSNAQIFRIQCRTIIAKLGDRFRFCFVDGPFVCSAGPDITLVYANYGPFRRWLRWLPSHAPIDATVASEKILDCINTTMEEDDALGATGPWVAVLGFSQGAKLGATLLLRQQMKEHIPWTSGTDNTSFKFGVLMAGRGPLVKLDDYFESTPFIHDASEATLESQPGENTNGDTTHIIRMPTLHVHGLKDEGIRFHRLLMKSYFDSKEARLMEWDGNHRIPFKSSDVEVIVQHVLEMAKMTGVEI